VAPASVTFTTANWNVARTVTVTGMDDAIEDGNIAYSIVTAPATSTDASYSNVNASDVAVTNADNDFTLTVTTVGNGTVTKNPNQTTYTYGTSVTLTATAGTGYTFTGWSGDTTTATNPLSLVITRDRSLTATFTINSYTLTVNTVGSGSVTKNPNQPTYNYGTPVTLTASPGTGHSFTGWSGDTTTTTNPLSLVITRNRSLTATFTINSYTLSVTTVGSGSVTKNPNQATYNYGTTVTLTANHGTGYSFSGWSGDTTAATNPLSLVITRNRSLTATFTINSYTLTVTTVGSGSVTANPDQPTYDHGTVVTLTATPAVGWRFTSWSGDTITTTNPLTLVMTRNRSLVATFTINSYTLAVTTVGNGTVSKTPNQSTYTYGTAVTLTANPATGWSFTGWSGDTTTDTNPLDLVMTRNRALTATFVIKTFALTLTTVGNGSITASPNQPTYNYGSVVQLTAVPAPGNYLSSWTGNASGTVNPLTITMDTVKTIVANFRSDDSRIQLPAHFATQLVAGGLDEPVGMAFLPDGRLLLVEKQTAKIRMIVQGAIAAIDPVCVVDSVAGVDPERGLLGIAVDPGWPARPFVYVYYTALGGSIRLSRYEAQGDLTNGSSGVLGINPMSRYDVLRDIPDSTEFHNAGGVRFGPDGMLYVSLGDDGDACAAQDSSSMKGVILRLDVSHLPATATGPPDRMTLAAAGNPFVASSDANSRLVWARGLRNPFRIHIDPANGGVFVSDVGLSTYEEIDRLDGSGLNFGWPFFEGPGSFVLDCGGTGPGPGLTAPIYSYDRTKFLGAASVIGADVYHASGCPTCDFPSDYEGDYFFADFYAGFLRRLKYSGGTWSIATPTAGQPSATNWALGFSEVADFLTGADGALWYCRMSTDFAPGTGEIGRIIYIPPVLDVGSGLPGSLTFAAPYPSPASDLVHFSYALPRAATADLAVYDIAGRVVRQLLRASPQPAGQHHLAWDGRTEGGSRAAPGVYMARLNVEGQSIVHRVVITH
jgi:uncharacterized repeat protein (TIGR02543 family)